MLKKATATSRDATIYFSHDSVLTSIFGSCVVLFASIYDLYLAKKRQKKQKIKKKYLFYFVHKKITIKKNFSVSSYILSLE